MSSQQFYQTHFIIREAAERRRKRVDLERKKRRKIESREEAEIKALLVRGASLMRCAALSFQKFLS